MFDRFSRRRTAFRLTMTFCAPISATFACRRVHVAAVAIAIGILATLDGATANRAGVPSLKLKFCDYIERIGVTDTHCPSAMAASGGDELAAGWGHASSGFKARRPSLLNTSGGVGGGGGGVAQDDPNAAATTDDAASSTFVTEASPQPSSGAREWAPIASPNARKLLIARFSRLQTVLVSLSKKQVSSLTILQQ